MSKGRHHFLFRAAAIVVAIPVLGLVLIGVAHPGCQEVVFAGTVGGLLVGAVHGPLHVYCLHERMPGGRRLSARRIRLVVVHDLVMDLVIGLLVGAMEGAARITHLA